MQQQDIRKRFDLDADTTEDAAKYLAKRGKQLLKDGWAIKDLEPVVITGTLPVAVVATFVPNQKHRLGNLEKHSNNYDAAQSIYILKKYRGQGLYQEIFKNKLRSRYPIITTPDCEMEAFLKAKNIPYFVRGLYQQNYEYKKISQVYGAQCQNRSRVEYMNHIDEGLAILTNMFSSIEPRSGSYMLDNSILDAFCLHPILQEDKLLDRELISDFNYIKGKTMMLATEYRNVANEYLPRHGFRYNADIRLSPLPHVNNMLIADKIQNRKDFEIHRDKYENADVLDKYFKAWCARLGISETEYRKNVEMLNGL